MDKAAQVYGWFLLFVTALPAAVRILMPKRVAAMEAERLSNERGRRNRRIMGLVALIGSPLFLLTYILGTLHLWVWFAVIVGLLSGADQLFAARYNDSNSMLWHTRIFGWVYAGAAIAVYFFLIRQ